ncbi:polysaccharide deacetylase family protein [Winogradskyella sp.]|uniref:polysaccharide deacetylase family protein n=1 Tax=Winogradskyella sp. TaxID=1883156 RepID=UPI0025DADBDE|nr:polysaccharide deacetylase family protein [Winogradskyella sp.]
MLWIRIKYKISLLYLTLALKLGLCKILLKNRYGERILVFHGIDSVGETKYNSRFISKSFFEEFIVFITANYNVITLEDFYEKRFKKGTLNIALTFDDGYLNNYKYALPILEKYNVPANFYITTIYEKTSYLWADFLDLVSFHTSKKEIVFEEKKYIKNTKNEFVNNGTSLKNELKRLPYKKIKLIYELFEDDWQALPTEALSDYWELMNASQIKHIADHSLFTIGSHAITHVNLTTINIEDAKHEILKSKKLLETICDKTINEFAFPFGYYTKQLADYCLDIGYKKVLLVDYNSESHKDNETFKNRFVMNPYISLKLQLAYLLKGSYF